MKFSSEVSDGAALKELGRRIARYRLNRNLTQSALAEEAGVSQRTLVRIEHGQSTQAANLIRILRALGFLENLEALVPAPAVSPLQQLQLHGKSRKRASSGPGKSGSREPQSKEPRSKEPWSWGLV